MIKYLSTILLSITLLSCGLPSKKLEAIKFYHYHLWLSNPDTVDLKSSATMFVETYGTNGMIEYRLKYSESDSLIAFKYSIKSDSLFYQDVYCRVIATINLVYQGETIQLFVSDFDEPNLNDEESYLFWNAKYGVLGQYNWSMGPVILFEPYNLKGFSKILYDYIVKRETSKDSNTAPNQRGCCVVESVRDHPCGKCISLINFCRCRVPLFVFFWE